MEGCEAALQPSIASVSSELRKQAVAELRKSTDSSLVTQADVDVETPRQFTLEAWIREAKECGAVVFIAGEAPTSSTPSS